MHAQNLNSCVVLDPIHHTHPPRPQQQEEGVTGKIIARSNLECGAVRASGAPPPQTLGIRDSVWARAYVHVSARGFSLPCSASIPPHAPREGGARGRGSRRLEGPDGGVGPGADCRGSKLDARWRGKRKPGDSCMHGTGTPHTDPCVRMHKAGGERRRRSAGAGRGQAFRNQLRARRRRGSNAHSSTHGRELVAYLLPQLPG